MEPVLAMYAYGSISATASGSALKPALVLLHSLWLSSRMFDRLVEDLQDEFHIIRFDVFTQPDTTSDGPEVMDLKLAASECLLILDDLGIEHYHVLGQSMGGDIALRMAIAQPTRVLSMALFGTSCAPAPPARLDGMFAWINEISERGFSDIDRERALATLIGPSTREAKTGNSVVDLVEHLLSFVSIETVPAMRGVFGRGGVCRELSTVNAPAIVVTGSEDVARNVDMGVELAHRLPNASFLEIPNCGHTPILEQYSLCLSELRGFWARVAVALHAN